MDTVRFALPTDEEAMRQALENSPKFEKGMRTHIEWIISAFHERNLLGSDTYPSTFAADLEAVFEEFERHHAGPIATDFKGAFREAVIEVIVVGLVPEGQTREFVWGALSP